MQSLFISDTNISLGGETHFSAKIYFNLTALLLHSNTFLVSKMLIKVKVGTIVWYITQYSFLFDSGFFFLLCEPHNSGTIPSDVASLTCETHQPALFFINFVDIDWERDRNRH